MGVDSLVESGLGLAHRIAIHHRGTSSSAAEDWADAKRVYRTLIFCNEYSTHDQPE